MRFKRTFLKKYPRALNEVLSKPYGLYIGLTLWLDRLDSDKLIELASPIKFDGGLTSRYFREYGDRNPLGFSGIDGKSKLQGFLGDDNINFKKLLGEGELPHNALKDSQIQAIEEELLQKMIEDVNAGAQYQEMYRTGGIEGLINGKEVKRIICWANDTIASIRHSIPGDRIMSYESIISSQ